MIAVVYVYKEVRDTYVYIVWVNLQECGGNTQYVNKQTCLDHLGVYMHTRGICSGNQLNVSNISRSYSRLTHCITNNTHVVAAAVITACPHLAKGRQGTGGVR